MWKTYRGKCCYCPYPYDLFIDKMVFFWRILAFIYKYQLSSCWHVYTKSCYFLLIRYLVALGKCKFAMILFSRICLEWILYLLLWFIVFSFYKVYNYLLVLVLELIRANEYFWWKYCYCCWYLFRMWQSLRLFRL